MSLLGWSKPKCPVGLREKAWVEMRLRWLGEQFGVERLTRGEVILPTEQYFPEDYDETPAAAQTSARSHLSVYGHPAGDHRTQCSFGAVGSGGGRAAQIVRLGRILQIVRFARTAGSRTDRADLASSTSPSRNSPIRSSWWRSLPASCPASCSTQRKLLENEPDRDQTAELAAVFSGTACSRPTQR